MIKSGRSLRLARLLKGDHEPLFLVPMDHTLTDGPFTDAQRYDRLQNILAANGADAIVVHKGRLGLLSPLVYSQLAVVVHISASTRYAPDPNYKYQVGDAEDCLRRGADAISVHVNLGSVTEDQQIRMMANTADACDRVGLPMIAMIYPRGPGVKDRPPLETVMHAAALAADLGVDIVKLPLSGSVQDMTQVVASCPIPVVTAGGAQVSDGDFNQFVANVMRAGARGIAAGRNIFMAADPAAKVREVRKILDSHYAGAPIRAPLAVGSADQAVPVGSPLRDWPLLDQRGVDA
jgi:2-amino-4,5-dihydroxy-6-oxo-7-(phosphonooxy)heptanoate synthase